MTSEKRKKPTGNLVSPSPPHEPASPSTPATESTAMGRRSARGRTDRLSRGLSGTNLARAGDYNQRIVLQAIRRRPETTRPAIARETGLTEATVANITNRLMDAGLIRSIGRLQGGRGQPALRFQIAADGAFGIGLNIDRDHLSLIALDLAGQVRSRKVVERAFAMPNDVVAFVAAHLPDLLSEGQIAHDVVVGAGVALPDDLGLIAMPGRPAGYERWSGIEIPKLLAGVFPWSIHADNDAAAAALGEVHRVDTLRVPSFFYLLITAGLGGGLVLDRSYHRGAHGRSGEIGLMPDLSAGTTGALVQDVVSISALQARLAAAGADDALRSAPIERSEAATTVIDSWLADAARSLAGPLSSVVCLFDPDAILIGGRLPVELIDRLVAVLDQELARMGLPSRTTIRAASSAEDASAIGAAMLPLLNTLLPLESVLAADPSLPF